MADDNDLDVDELLDDEVPEDPALLSRFEILKSRCESSKVLFEQIKDEDGDHYGRLRFPDGKNTRTVSIYGVSKADALLGFEFENYRFIPGYEAIGSYKEKYIEASVGTTSVGWQFLWRRLTGGDQNRTSIVIDPPSGGSVGPTLELGPASKEFQALRRSGIPSRLTIKLRNSRSTQNDSALNELKSYTDSLFFQIDKLHGSTFVLDRERRIRTNPLRRKNSPDVDITYPTAHYNPDAMSLYYYALSARGLPLLKFLAFYQTIEFYFPRYSQAEARKRLGSILKSPTFRSYRDDDLDRVLAAIRLGRGGGFGDEKSQLRSVISECVSAEELRTYLTSEPDREEHFLKSKRYSKIPIASKNADLRNETADRIYDIRCNIVHTKADSQDGDLPMLLPFSDDAQYLTHDIDLVQFLASAVLISSSSELT